MANSFDLEVGLKISNVDEIVNELAKKINIDIGSGNASTPEKVEEKRRENNDYAESSKQIEQMLIRIDSLSSQNLDAVNKNIGTIINFLNRDIGDIIEQSTQGALTKLGTTIIKQVNPSARKSLLKNLPFAMSANLGRATEQELGDEFIDRIFNDPRISRNDKEKMISIFESQREIIQDDELLQKVLRGIGDDGRTLKEAQDLGVDMKAINELSKLVLLMNAPNMDDRFNIIKFAYSQLESLTSQFMFQPTTDAEGAEIAAGEYIKLIKLLQGQEVDVSLREFQRTLGSNKVMDVFAIPTDVANITNQIISGEVKNRFTGVDTVSDVVEKYTAATILRMLENMKENDPEGYEMRMQKLKATDSQQRMEALDETMSEFRMVGFGTTAIKGEKAKNKLAQGYITQFVSGLSQAGITIEREEAERAFESRLARSEAGLIGGLTSDAMFSEVSLMQIFQEAQSTNTDIKEIKDAINNINQLLGQNPLVFDFKPAND